jgi:hypothetical protein
MLQDDQKLRTIVESHRFSLELKEIIKDAPAADDFVFGVKHRLARSPQDGKRIGESHVWFLPMVKQPNLMPVVLYYTFDEESVILLSITETLYPSQK